MSDLCLYDVTSLTFRTNINDVLSVIDVGLSKHRSLIYIRPKYIRGVTLFTHRSLIYIRPKCQRRRPVFR
jgi:hypothetical protein